MQRRRFVRIALAKFIVVGCAGFFSACCAYAQYFEPAPPPPPVFNPSYPYTVPQPPYKPLSPAIPSTLLGSGANSRMDGSLPSAVTHSHRHVAKARQVRTLHHHRSGSMVLGSTAESYYYSPFGDGYGCVWRRGWGGYWFRTLPCY
jgi:hypothetical protein